VAAVRVEFEAEGDGGVLGPEGGGAMADIGVEGWVGGAGAPEFVDGGAEDGAGNEEPGGVGGVRMGGEAEEGEGGLVLGGVGVRGGATNGELGGGKRDEESVRRPTDQPFPIHGR